MKNNYTKVIGFFSYTSPTEVLCTDGSACIIAGSEYSMKNYIKEMDPTNNKFRTIRKTRFGDIMKGLKLGAAYGFDKDSYNKFYPLAIDEGLEVMTVNFDEQELKGNRFITVQIDIKNSEK